MMKDRKDSDGLKTNLYILGSTFEHAETVT